MIIKKRLKMEKILLGAILCSVLLSGCSTTKQEKAMVVDLNTSKNTVQTNHRTVRQNCSNGNTKNIVSYVEGELDGLVKTYKCDGTLLKEENWKKGELHGTSKYFHENGRIAHEFTMHFGVKDGKETKFLPNGRLILEKNFNKGSLNLSQKEFNKDGIITAEKEYDNGKLIFIKEYDNGALIFEKKY